MASKRRSKEVAKAIVKKAKVSVGEKTFCSYVQKDGVPQIYADYHDAEWGRPCKDDNQLFEMLSLEGAQAGLSFITILKKREGYRRLFNNFDIELVAQMSEQEIAKIATDPAIVRHKAKVASVVNNARLVLDIKQDGQSFADYVWSFQPASDDTKEARKDKAQHMSDDLKKRGFKFVGPTIVYAFFQACGVVNDHSPNCPAYKSIVKDYHT
uniref:DNA-3-methyladenine glycosylase I n=1 Tax=Mucochytrium quahogii TaxID=96639 RepID=A0A7S2WKW2_9STRA|mmetsp:Transcript_24034/g.38474  ORF Transcript_24034/g.38474 Transcript_24034/m.38474 type:complete len:211 (-) Transcript_24034:2006-2638(-)